MVTGIGGIGSGGVPPSGGGGGPEGPDRKAILENLANVQSIGGLALARTSQDGTLPTGYQPSVEDRFQDYGPTRLTGALGLDLGALKTAREVAFYDGVQAVLGGLRQPDGTTVTLAPTAEAEGFLSLQGTKADLGFDASLTKAIICNIDLNQPVADQADQILEQVISAEGFLILTAIESSITGAASDWTLTVSSDHLGVFRAGTDSKIIQVFHVALQGNGTASVIRTDLSGSFNVAQAMRGY